VKSLLRDLGAVLALESLVLRRPYFVGGQGEDGIDGRGDEEALLKNLCSDEVGLELPCRARVGKVTLVIAPKSVARIASQVGEAMAYQRRCQ
jgi:hypothetical protein